MWNKKTFFGEIPDLYDTWLEEALAKAEEAGLEKVTIPNAKGMLGWKVGQIIDYRPPKQKKELKKIKHRFPKKVWKIESVIPGTLRSWSSHTEYTEEQLGSATYVCLGENFKYVHNRELTKKEIDQIVHEKSFGMLAVGKYIINENGIIGQVTKIFTKQMRDTEASFQDKVNNPHGDFIEYDQIHVACRYEEKYHADTAIKFEESEEEELEKFLKEWSFIPDDKLEDFFKKINHVAVTKELKGFNDVLAIGNAENDPIETSTALVGSGSSQHLQMLHDKIAVRKNEAETLKAGLERTIELERQKMEELLEKKREELEQVHQHLQEAMTVFKRQMEKIHRLIITLEIYMGVTEEVVQIAEGEKAPDSEPISLRQQVLFMDEEFGDPKNGGIDHRTIEAFETWLVQSGNYQKVIPEKKSVVIMRPRRVPKDYGNFWANMRLQDLDKMVYIFIRNGDNLYRIMTDHIKFQDRLFPKKSELQDMYERMSAHMQQAEQAESDYDNKKAMEKVDDVDKEFFYYRRNILLLQGIIFRTDIFVPVPQGLNMMDIKTYTNPDGTDRVRFIYDDENALPSGRLSFQEWHREINKKIVKGSRIVVVKNLISDDTFVKRIAGVYLGRHDYRNYAKVGKPHNGIYEVKQRMIPMSDYETETVSPQEYKRYKRGKYKDGHVSINLTKTKEDNDLTKSGLRGHPWDDSNVESYVVYKKDKKGNKIEKQWEEPEFYISFNPKDEVTYSAGWDYDPHERKNNITMSIQPVKDSQRGTDKFIINYDALLVDDIDFYLNSRVDREYYLEMMPVLWEMKYRLIEEKQWETGFVESLSRNLSVELKLEEKVIAEEMWQAVEWWKNEIVTVWKRPIAKDDAKAWRMITQRVKSNLKKKFKLDIALEVLANNQVQVFKWRNKIAFYGTGLTKKEFAALVYEKAKEERYIRIEHDYIYAHDDLSLAKIMRESTFSKNYMPKLKGIIESVKI